MGSGLAESLHKYPFEGIVSHDAHLSRVEQDRYDY